MTAREIKAALVLRGVRQSDIARKLKLSPAYISDVIARNRRSDRVERAVAQAIGEPVNMVFTETAT